jgi:hypothetical protein
VSSAGFGTPIGTRRDADADAGPEHRCDGYATIWELNQVPCREAPPGSAHRVKGPRAARPTTQETTMPKYLLHDEDTPQELAGGRS